jgi:glycosyltransferase involved in cell wall biosynthesis
VRLLVDATTLLAWADRPPVGTVRIERVIVGDLCRSLPEAELAFFKVREGALVPVTLAQRATIEGLAAGPRSGPASPPGAAGHRRSALRIGRRVRRWLKATRRASARADAEATLLSGATDLLTMGHGWDYLDHTRLASLRERHGFRVHAFVHDLIAVAYPHYFHEPAEADRIRRHHVELCRVADVLITNSQATRVALERFIAEGALPRPRLHVASPPPFVTPATPAAPLPAGLGDEPFVLYVSTLEIRKNHRLLLRVWSECRRAGQELPKLVLVGRIGWGVEEALRMLRHDPALAGRVLLLEDVPDAQLATLYRHCLFTVYPSLVEGWGLPISEALSFDKVCLHADDPAQHEAAQGLMPALHADDYLAWASEIVELARNDGRRAMLESNLKGRFYPCTTEGFCASVKEALRLPGRPGTLHRQDRAPWSTSTPM